MAPITEVLDQEFLGHQRALLAEQRSAAAQILAALASEIRNHMERMETGAPPTEGFGSGEIESMELERARDQRRAVLARLAEIDAAVARLGAGAYGVCEVCGRQIGRARLEAIPTATRCIECQGRARRF